MWKKYVSTQCPPKTRKAEMGAQNNKSGRTSMQAGAAKHTALKNGGASSGKKATTQVTSQESKDYSADNALKKCTLENQKSQKREPRQASQTKAPTKCSASAVAGAASPLSAIANGCASTGVGVTSSIDQSDGWCQCGASAVVGAASRITATESGSCKLDSGDREWPCQRGI